MKIAEEIDKEQKIAVLVYKEDHPDAYPPEISTATGVDFHNVIHILREYESKRTRYQIQDQMEYFSKEEADRAAAGLFKAGGIPQVENVTLCAFYINGRNGYKHYCEHLGPHEEHGALIMGMWEEWDGLPG